MQTRNQYVVPWQKKHWAVKDGKDLKTLRIFKSREEAQAYAKNVAKRNNSCAFISSNGTIVKVADFYY